MYWYDRYIAPRRVPQKAGRVLIGVLAGIALVLLISIAHDFNRSKTRVALSAGATLIDIGGRRMRLVCSGVGARTYVLEAGATGFAETWTWVQDALDDGARVCAYDRAGLGLSDPPSDGFKPGRVAQDLRTALAAARERGPFVLVGHSLGGFFVRDFATQYPQDTQALVLVDSSHEDQLDHLPPETVDGMRNFSTLLRLLSHLSRTGLLQFWNPLADGAQGLSGGALAAARFLASDRQHLAASADEMARWDDITDRIRRHDPDRSLPVLVVSAGSAVPGQPDFSDAIQPLHQELAARFESGTHAVIDTADHFSILMDREHGVALARLIEDYAERHLQ